MNTPPRLETSGITITLPGGMVVCTADTDYFEETPQFSIQDLVAVSPIQGEAAAKRAGLGGRTVTAKLRIWQQKADFIAALAAVKTTLENWPAATGVASIGAIEIPESSVALDDLQVASEWLRMDITITGTALAIP